MEGIQTSQSFGAYQIERKLGAGGMGTVFKAVHLESGQEVALKILHDQFADDSTIRKRFEHEAATAARLDHPNIVPVRDFGEYKRRLYLVMPYMQIGSFADFFSNPRPIRHNISLRILTFVASAIDYAHSQGVIHRDIKLENILVGNDNIPAISDFGIAQSVNTTRITMTGQILGTPHYLAPENFEELKEPDYRADLYSFAVIAYLLFTGFFPFTGKDPLTLIVKHRDQVVPPPSLIKLELPSELDTIFERALAKDPNDRFPSAQDLVDSLAAAFVDVPNISTMIYLNEPNPMSSTYNVLSQPAGKGGRPSNVATQVLSPQAETISAGARREGENRTLLPFRILALLMACGWLGLFYWGLNNFWGTSSDAGGAKILIPLSNFDASEEVTASASPTSTITDTPTITSTFTSTSTGTITATYTFIPSSTYTAIRRTPTATVSPTLTPSNTAASIGNPQVTRPPRTTNRPHPTNTFIPAATNTPQPSNTFTPVPTSAPQPSDTPILPTLILPTPIPPTDVPPTDVPPTDVPPPTDRPPTDALPPVDVPPTTIPLLATDASQGGEASNGE